MKVQNHQSKKQTRTEAQISIGIAIGAGVGVALGIAIGNIALGIAVGVALAVALWAAGAAPATEVVDEPTRPQALPTPGATRNRRQELLLTLRRHSVVSYFVIAFAVSWIIWIPMVLANVRVYQGSSWPTHVPGMIGPIVAAVLMSALVGGGAGVKDLLSRTGRWRVAGRWYLAALSPLAFFAIAAVGMVATGRGWPVLGELGKFTGLPVVAAPIMWVVLLILAFAEETGWRGFAVPAMLKTRSFLTTAVVIGLLWALWHLPSVFLIDQYKQMGIAIVPMFLFGMVSGSIFLTWLYRASGGSIFMVALWHASYNLVSGTAAAHGLVAAVVTTAVMTWAVVIVVMELRTARRTRSNRGTTANFSIARAGRGHLVNPIVRAMLRSPAHRLLSGSLLVLEYTGRRTRNRHSIPVGYVQSGVDRDLIVVAGQPATKKWWRNFDALPQQVTVLMSGQPKRASARLVKGGTPEYLGAMDTYSKRLPRAGIESGAPVLIITPAG